MAYLSRCVSTSTALERLPSCFLMHEPSCRFLASGSMYSTPVFHSLIHHFQLITLGHDLVNVKYL